MSKVRSSSRTIVKALYLKSWVFWLSALLCAAAVMYWGLIASDRYVSEAHVIIQQIDSPSGKGLDISSMIGMSGGSTRADQMFLRDHLLSVDMLAKLDSQLGLREHYSDRRYDMLSRLWSQDISQEWFHSYYLRRIGVALDENAGVLIVRAEAFTPEKAYEITSLLVEEGERYMNQMAHRLAQEQVAFIEKQVEQTSERVIKARQAVLAFQNERNLVSPQGTAEALFAIISQLEGRLIELKTKRDSLLGYQQAQSPAVVDLDLQVAAVSKQIAREQARLTSSQRQTLNRIVEEYQRLEMNAEFAREMYKAGLTALEKQRVEAGRMLKMASVLQHPTHPQYPLEPRRTYNTTVFILSTLLVAGILTLLKVIVRDHRD
ncbi:MAG: chain-length determining protein [Nitrospira sp.]|nr:MAG: chain-length determining protein [Nitrospira sp.]